jgi:hypothetical protein
MISNDRRASPAGAPSRADAVQELLAGLMCVALAIAACRVCPEPADASRRRHARPAVLP